LASGVFYQQLDDITSLLSDKFRCRKFKIAQTHPPDSTASGRPASVIWPALTAAAPEEERLYSLKQNQKIQADRHIFYVEQIVRQLLLIVLQRRAIRAMNLCTPCYSW